MAYWTARIILWLVAVCYGIFAFGRVLNMLGMGGFDWATAPLEWQVIDVFYLAINVAVVFGFVLLRPIGFMAFFLAVVTQFALFWAVSPGEGVDGAPIRGASVFLSYFVPFHIITVVLVVVALFLLRRRDRPEPAE
ncbi:hypothetical protein [Bauldia litoralis]|uniref:hypothetical protein n=1 Tax=Bauldia litoralis TaxID=665467 RepID=UPI003263E415